eukprot:m.105819 g.105819  ORF g.105819 m.105819 type:complete len:166 (+) comp13287_c2_seq1:730-1227(+)
MLPVLSNTPSPKRKAKAKGKSTSPIREAANLASLPPISTQARIGSSVSDTTYNVSVSVSESSPPGKRSSWPNLFCEQSRYQSAPPAHDVSAKANLFVPMNQRAKAKESLALMGPCSPRTQRARRPQRRLPAVVDRAVLAQVQQDQLDHSPATPTPIVATSTQQRR